MNIHKILGLLLSILFFMWFVSGIVMIYHSFPRASIDKRMKNQAVLAGTLPDQQQILAALPDSAEIQSISMEMYFDRPILQFRGKNAPDSWFADSLHPLEPGDKTIEKTVASWCPAPVQRIDSLYEPDQWIPFGRSKEDFPIYKYTFTDDARHELYIAKDGKVLQLTDKNERFWAWLGAIPHWVYFTTLRQNQPLWINFVKWTSGIGTIMCLIGMVLAVLISRKKRIKQLGSPFRKRWYHWHYVSGIVFGFFAATFALSGMMSLMDIPDWLKKAPKEKQERQEKGHFRERGSRGEKVSPEAYLLDYRKVLTAIGGVKSIEWTAWKQYPYYRVTTDETLVNIDASDSLAVGIFMLTEEMVRKEVRKTYGDSIPYRMELIHEYDTDYFSLKKEEHSLPVYRIIVDDPMHTRHYYNPQTLAQRQIDDDGRTRHLLYRGLHCLEFKFLTDHPILWNIVMYFLMIGGTFLSLTGVVLTYKWLSRKIRKAFRKIIRTNK